MPREKMWRMLYHFKKPRSGGRDRRGRTTAFHRGGKVGTQHRPEHEGIPEGHIEKYYLQPRLAQLVNKERTINFPMSFIPYVSGYTLPQYDPFRTSRTMPSFIPFMFRPVYGCYLPAAEGQRFVNTRFYNSATMENAVRPNPNVPGHVMPLFMFNPGTKVSHVQFYEGAGWNQRFAVAAGTSALIDAKQVREANMRLKMPSGEERNLTMFATGRSGMVSNVGHSRKHLGKAGVARRLGRRPRVKANAMNPNDHPGVGKWKHKRTPWGKFFK
eukprot:Clim_evm37s215 gene=Clim_evmTU37s215